MIIKHLELEHFRNYEKSSVDFCPQRNIIFGNNAQGKTNLLEAISFLSLAKGIRAKKDSEQISFGEEEARVKAKIDTQERDFEVEALLFGKRRRLFFVNGVRQKTAAGQAGLLRTVFFSPDDLYIIKEGAAERRRFIDMILCQLRPGYAKAVSEYNRLYDHKARILRDGEKKPSLYDTLIDFNYRMAEVGAVIIGYRARFADKLSEIAAEIHLEFSGGLEELKIEYKTVGTVTDAHAERETICRQLHEHQKEHIHAEIESRNCLSGPHKDELDISINGQTAKRFASQGQTRTAALSMKLAEREIHRRDSGEYPVLLLDDVLSELDKSRQEFVLNHITEGQVLITCCEDGGLASLSGGKILRLHEGKIT